MNQTENIYNTISMIILSMILYSKNIDYKLFANDTIETINFFLVDKQSPCQWCSYRIDFHNILAGLSIFFQKM